MSKLGIAVIGTGHIAQGYHLPSLARLAGEGMPIRLCALCDLDVGRAQAAAKRFGFARIYGDYHAMLDAEAPDAVWALVPTPAMCEVAGYLLAHNVPTFLEKPPGQDVREARELAEIAATHHTPHQVAFNRRYAPLLVRMKALLAEAGPVSALSCQFYRHKRTEAHFAFGTGLHGLDALRFLGDGEVCEVHTRLGERGSALATLVYDSGACATFEMLPQVGVQSERYTAHAGERTVVVDGCIAWLKHFPGFLHCYDGNQLALSVDNNQDRQPPEVVSGFYGESAQFITCLLQGTPPGPDLASALRSLEIAEAVDRGESVVWH
jgi:myo-inositol 2-dehydrogenase / D-chiro-inositol 1-dehydrogenase